VMLYDPIPRGSGFPFRGRLGLHGEEGKGRTASLPVGPRRQRDRKRKEGALSGGIREKGHAAWALAHGSVGSPAPCRLWVEDGADKWGQAVSDFSQGVRASE